MLFCICSNKLLADGFSLHVIRKLVDRSLEYHHKAVAASTTP